MNHQVAYMGASRPSSTLNDLMNCHMRGWNGREVVHLSVMEHFSKFMAIIKMLDQETPYATNICALYHGVWYMELKRFVDVEDYATLPRAAGETNGSQGQVAGGP